MNILFIISFTESICQKIYVLCTSFKMWKKPLNNCDTLTVDKITKIISLVLIYIGKLFSNPLCAILVASFHDVLINYNSFKILPSPTSSSFAVPKSMRWSRKNHLLASLASNSAIFETIAYVPSSTMGPRNSHFDGCIPHFGQKNIHYYIPTKEEGQCGFF